MPGRVGAVVILDQRAQHITAQHLAHRAFQLALDRLQRVGVLFGCRAGLVLALPSRQRLMEDRDRDLLIGEREAAVEGFAIARDRQRP